MSVTVQVTIVVPTGYVAVGWLLTTDCTPQLSPVVGATSVTSALQQLW